MLKNEAAIGRKPKLWCHQGRVKKHPKNPTIKNTNRIIISSLYYPL